MEVVKGGTMAISCADVDAVIDYLWINDSPQLGAVLFYYLSGNIQCT
ncbi:MAG: hypothetical protein JXR51_16130 [Bacteroidales bacterium]|nr:hypothetical protein [Bacteroidales bacterium]MBN2758696.1 hypothetical protein [Bacteroidales bacterium]